MKKILFILFLLPALAFGQVITHVSYAPDTSSTGGGTPPVANMLQDGDFAQGDDGYWVVGASWDVTGGNGSYTCCNVSTLTQVTTDMNAVYETDTDYNITFDIVTSGDGIWMKLQASDNGGTSTDLTAGINYTTDSYSLNFTTPSSIGGGAFTIYAWGDASGTIDNIVLTER